MLPRKGQAPATTGRLRGVVFAHYLESRPVDHKLIPVARRRGRLVAGARAGPVLGNFCLACLTKIAIGVSDQVAQPGGHAGRRRRDSARALGRARRHRRGLSSTPAAPCHWPQSAADFVPDICRRLELPFCLLLCSIRSQFALPPSGGASAATPAAEKPISSPARRAVACR